MISETSMRTKDKPFSPLDTLRQEHYGDLVGEDNNGFSVVSCCGGLVEQGD